MSVSMEISTALWNWLKTTSNPLIISFTEMFSKLLDCYDFLHSKAKWLVCFVSVQCSSSNSSKLGLMCMEMGYHCPLQLTNPYLTSLSSDAPISWEKINLRSLTTSLTIWLPIYDKSWAKGTIFMKVKARWMASWLIFKPQQNPKSSQLRLKPGFMDTANNIKSSVKKKNKKKKPSSVGDKWWRKKINWSKDRERKAFKLQCVSMSLTYISLNMQK